ncbi:TPA: DUF3990 domain-containing protein [Bacillus cereus]|nr:DUF3990 domain-containing protein [Bacillus cereus]HDR8266800.1 DUF3990 domain-containing protein [Bacillus cereus]HDR8271975.1 DUF3990 domain-containing protein [Bacillus cereus]HDR8277344.1 DUF3990 domain-containing protein [Bacillus cereus]HDR8282809.1 DUF3990 domain-containing protein [Bacillus cereus]
MNIDLTSLEIPNLWYHGTIQIHATNIMDDINLNIAQPNLDFGKGFYLTSNPFQAWKRAVSKTNLHNKNRNRILKHTPDKKIEIAVPAIIEFEIDLTILSFLNGLKFDKEDLNWAKFILSNRSKTEIITDELHNKDNQFDYIYGPMADGYGLSAIIEEAEETGNINKFFNDILGKHARFPEENQLSIHTEIAKSAVTSKGVIYNEPSKSFRR